MNEDNQDKNLIETQEEGEKLKLDFKDRIAIILAVWRIILPWGILIVAIYFILLFLYDILF